MKLALFSYTAQGCRTARRVLSCFPDPDKRAYTVERLATGQFLPIPRTTKPFYQECFSWADALIFVGSCGIAVRQTAPHVQDKQSDPAVICIDELGHFVIPLLSGHIGGANALALQVAEQLNAVPVITTATDLNGKFSVDTWAAKNGFLIDDLSCAKAVSSAILERDIPLLSDFPIRTGYPDGTVSGSEGELGICLSYQIKAPFQRTLRLIPRLLHVGVGCRKGTRAGLLHKAISSVLHQHGLDIRAVKCVATIDLKSHETGLLECCKQNNWPVSFYPAQQLREVPGIFTPSAFVQRTTGVDNVCERAALIGADRLIVKKTALNGVTVAVAAEYLEVHFEKSNCCRHRTRGL